MSGRYLLDTSVIVPLFAGDASVKEELERATAVFVPCVALGELYYGAHKSRRKRENLARLEEFRAAVEILGCDEETTREYGKIKNSLRAKGQPIPENDIWIAAIASQHQLIVASRDAHFQQIPGLKTATW